MPYQLAVAVWCRGDLLLLACGQLHRGGWNGRRRGAGDRLRGRSWCPRLLPVPSYRADRRRSGATGRSAAGATSAMIGARPTQLGRRMVAGRSDLPQAASTTCWFRGGAIGGCWPLCARPDAGFGIDPAAFRPKERSATRRNGTGLIQPALLGADHRAPPSCADINATTANRLAAHPRWRNRRDHPRPAGRSRPLERATPAHGTASTHRCAAGGGRRQADRRRESFF